jgi:hypothetical protein
VQGDVHRSIDNPAPAAHLLRQWLALRCAEAVGQVRPVGKAVIEPGLDVCCQPNGNCQRPSPQRGQASLLRGPSMRATRASPRTGPATPSSTLGSGRWLRGRPDGPQRLEVPADVRPLHRRRSETACLGRQPTTWRNVLTVGSWPRTASLLAGVGRVSPRGVGMMDAMVLANFGRVR